MARGLFYRLLLGESVSRVIDDRDLHHWVVSGAALGFIACLAEYTRPSVRRLWREVCGGNLMGVDMSGWVEVIDTVEYGDATSPVGRQWHGVIQTDFIVSRYYDMFGMLFGIMNYSNLPPVVGVRGLPSDLSSQSAKAAKRLATFAQSWITWQEVKAIDWSVEAVDGRPRRYTRDEDGRLISQGKSAPMVGDVIEEGRTWECGEEFYRIERISRRQVLDVSREWQLLFDLMARLGQDYGDEFVRLVVWFDR